MAHAPNINRHTLFAALAVLLAACGGPASPAGGGVTSIDGTVRNWTGGAANVEFVPPNGPSLASAPLKADGTFTLALPDAREVGPYLKPLDSAVNALALTGAPNGCSFDDLQLGDGGQALLLTTLNVTKSGTAPATITGGTATSGANSAVNFDLRGWFYSQGAVSVSGTASCSDTVGGVTTDFMSTVTLDLAPGWNEAALKGSSVSGAGQGGSTSRTTNLTLSTVAGGASVWSTADGLAQSSGR